MQQLVEKCLLPTATRHPESSDKFMKSSKNLPKCDFQVERVNVSGKRKPATSRKSFATRRKANTEQQFRNSCSDELKAGLELKSQLLHLSSLLTWFTITPFYNEFERTCFHIRQIWEVSCSSASQMFLLLRPLQKPHKELTSGLDAHEENNCKRKRGYALMWESTLLSPL